MQSHVSRLQCGAVGDPRRARKKFATYLQEKREGVVRTKTGKRKYKLKKGEAVKKFLGGKPGSQRAFKAKKREKAEKAERRAKRREKRREKRGK